MQPFHTVKKKRRLAPGQSKSGIPLGFPIPSSVFFNSQPHKAAQRRAGQLF